MKLAIALLALTSFVAAQTEEPVLITDPVPDELLNAEPVTNDPDLAAIFDNINTLDVDPSANGNAINRGRGGRIVRGLNATLGQYPYAALLYMRSKSGSWYTCTGSFISCGWVLTAGHCVKGYVEIRVYGGLIDRNGPYVFYQAITTTTNFKVHANYNAKTIANDIALVQLPNFDCNTFANSGGLMDIIRLPCNAPDNTNLFVGNNITMLGWGKDADAATSASQFLKYGFGNVMTNSQCALTYGNTILSSNICVDTTNPLASTCSGDSGGPLVGSLSSVVGQIGVTSFGASAGCELGYPAAFTRVTSYCTWIRSFIPTI